MGARGALEGIFWPRLEHTQHSQPSPGPNSCPRTLRPDDGNENPEHLVSGEGSSSKPESQWINSDSFPRLTEYHGKKMPPGCTTPPDIRAQTDPSLNPAPQLPKEKQPPAQHPAVPAPDKAPPRPGARAQRAHAPSRLTPRHLHKQGAKHPRAHAPGTRRDRRAASPQRLVRARAHAATRGHTRGPLPPQGPGGLPSAPRSACGSVGPAPPGPIAGGGEARAAPDSPPALLR